MMKFEPTAENYRRCKGQKMKCGRYIVLVRSYRTESRAGTWERGFKFSNSDWGMLERISDHTCSMDHGKTWHTSPKAALKSKGKIKLASESHGELAFEGIQKLNREFYGPGYRWQR